MSQRSSTFYCFSPPVMLATLLIEVFFAAYILWRYKLTIVTKLVVAVLLALATFQGAEYMICGGLGIQPGLWSKIGYSAITLLPPLGIHLIHAISGKKARPIVYAAYATGIAFIAFFTFVTGAISGQTCYANYVVFEAYPGSTLVYGAYYYGWLTVGVALALRYARTVKDHHIATALRALAIGYLAFMVPTTAANIVDPATISAIPSIMCGFAVILAFILVGKVAPEAIALKSTSHSFRLKLPF